tara:strand:- start:83 stop:2155 length:2073 start_codon:yes stop_codon:yes gene_type:complete
MNLSKSQTKAFEEIKSFLKSNKNIFILKGYAGTGKTTLISFFTSYLIDKKIPFELMASTGRAAKVATDKIKIPAYTIHKSIYSMDDIKERKITQEDGSETFRYFYTLKQNESPPQTLYIVDESSMISDVLSEGEFFVFGSGLLLQDLLKFSNMTYNRKILFIGDNAQLPPVRMSFSPALDTNYIKNKYNICTNSYELTDILRQDKESGIVKNATTLREQISKNLFNKFILDFSYNDFKSINEEELYRKYLELYNNKSKTIIIAFSNKGVYWYNQTIRKKIFNNSSIQKKDKIIVIRNNYKYGLLNGQLGLIDSITSDTEVKPVNLKTKEGTVCVNLIFINAKILIRDLNNKLNIIPVKLLLNSLESDKPNLTSEEQRALYVFFKMRMKEKNIKSKTPEYKNAIKDDPYFNALIIKYGYAVTCHKSQGGEWSDVFIDMNIQSNNLNKFYFKWVYTAITRSTKNVYCLNAPNIDIFGTNSNKQKIIRKDNSIQKKEILNITEDIEIEKLVNNESDNQLEVKLKSKILSILNTNENYKIDNLKWIGAYRIRFIISSNNSGKISFDIIINGKKKVTLVECKNKEFKKQLECIKGFKLINNTNNSNIKKEYQKEFIEEIQKSLLSNILIENIDIKTDYHIVLTFVHLNTSKEINFYFDKTGCFKSATYNKYANNNKIDYIVNNMKQLFNDKIKVI